jgi:hypothetical protein
MPLDRFKDTTTGQDLPVSTSNRFPVRSAGAAGLTALPSEAATAWSYAAATLGIVNSTTAVTIKGAGGAGKKNYITSIDLVAEALGTATEFAIRDGAGGTVLWRIKIGTGGIVNGRHLVFATPLQSSANTLLEIVTLTASTTGAVYFNAQGYTE